MSYQAIFWTYVLSQTQTMYLINFQVCGTINFWLRWTILLLTVCICMSCSSYNFQFWTNNDLVHIRPYTEQATRIDSIILRLIILCYSSHVVWTCFVFFDAGMGLMYINEIYFFENISTWTRILLDSHAYCWNNIHYWSMAASPKSCKQPYSHPEIIWYGKQ